jgi:hypothetical protein
MSSMTYPPLVHDAATPAAWLQRSVNDYFGTIAWVPSPVSPPAPATPSAAAPSNPVPRSLDLSVVQYFANFPWSGMAVVPVVDPTEPIGPAPMLDPAAIADWLDFAPTVDPGAALSLPTKATLTDSGSLADFSDFF